MFPSAFQTAACGSQIIKLSHSPPSYSPLIYVPKVVNSSGVQVSWIRSGDSYILGVDDTMFISDRRFRILRPEEPGDEWNLHIK